MRQASPKVTFVEERRVAVSVRLPRSIHLRLREIALRRGSRVNDIYQEVLEEALGRSLPGEPFIAATPASAVAVTLWLAPDFAARLRKALLKRDLLASNFVLAALLQRFGRDELMRD